MAMIHPPYCVILPLRKALHSRPSPWIRRLVSRPGIEAYCGFSESLVQSVGGLFQPGTAVEPCVGVGGDSALGVFTAGDTCFTSVPWVGAVVGGGGVCASAAVPASAKAAPRI